MFGLPAEVLTVLFGTVTGFVFRYMAERAAERHAIVELAIKIQKANEEAANQAAQRDNSAAGHWIRRMLAISAVLAVVILPFMAGLIDMPTVVENTVKKPTFLFGLFGGGEKVIFTELKGYFLTPEIRLALLAITGFYFGNAVAKKQA